MSNGAQNRGGHSGSGGGFGDTLTLFFQEIARRLHEKHQKGGSRNYPGFEPGQPDPARFLFIFESLVFRYILDTLDALWPRGPGGFRAAPEGLQPLETAFKLCNRALRPRAAHV